MIVELEGLQVFPVDDGADGLVLVSWIERYSSSDVRPVPRSMTISRQEAQLLSDELAKASDALNTIMAANELLESSIGLVGDVSVMHDGNVLPKFVNETWGKTAAAIRKAKGM